MSQTPGAVWSQQPSKRMKMEPSTEEASQSSSAHKTELVRLLLQTLRQLHYHDVADMLQDKSGILLESPHVVAFRESVLTGDWEKCVSLLPQLNITKEDELAKVKVALAEQKYLELLEQGRHKEALLCLRQEISPIDQDTNHLHNLCGLIMCKSKNELHAKLQGKWGGANDTSRQYLLDSLRKYISPNVLIPERRLEALILQAQQWQISQCFYHNVEDTPISLFEDHVCPKTVVPMKVQQVLDQHTDEVWYISYSPCGQYLASASKDCSIIIWDLSKKPIASVHQLKEHTEAITYLDWSPDGSRLLSASIDHTVKLWDVQKGILIRSYNQHSGNHVSVVLWLSEQSFLSGGSDALIMMGTDGEVLKKWVLGIVNDVALSSDGTTAFVVSQVEERGIRVLSLLTGDEDFIPEKQPTISLALSADNKVVVLNTRGSQENHLWDVESKQLVQKYCGHTQQCFVIRSAFGGVCEGFVASGSEDSLVYIWHRQSGRPICVLEGHTGAVNTVKWNPVNPRQFASCSDDKTIRIWSSEDQSQAENQHP